MGDDLKSFKISDQIKAPIDKPKADAGATGPAPSAGFPRIEALIENDSIDLGDLKNRVSELQALSNSGEASPKEKGGARKASLAYRHLNELIEHLAATKASMLQKAEE